MNQPILSNLELTVDAGVPLSVRSFSVVEQASQLFHVHLVVASRDPSINLESIIGRGAKLRITRQLEHLTGGVRIWQGVCNSVAQSRVEEDSGDAHGESGYELTLVPTLWLLTQRRNYRIFQHRSVPDIADALLSEWGVAATWALDRARYPRLDYRVQYGESDYDFVSRLLEEAGISFAFLPSKDDPCLLTFSDALEQRAPCTASPLSFIAAANQGAGKEHVFDVEIALEARPNAWEVRDYDLRRPRFALHGRSESTAGPEPKGRYEQMHYQPGAFLVEVDKPGQDTPAADALGAARHDERFGRELAERELQAARGDRFRVQFGTNLVDLCPGTVFAIDRHPHAALATAKLLCTELCIAGSVESEWSIRGVAVLADTPHRPPRRAPRPVVTGVQSATVVGPEGEEIHTDELGRVRVKFPWDRDARASEHSSCWLRVNQGWAGTGYGMITLPRVGQEVLVGFLGGDPDQPIVVGRVFNSLQQVPYRLPEHKTRSTWKSDSSPGSGGFNELMFEDLKGKELVYVQAERNLRKLVKHDETITVGRHRNKLVKGNETETTGIDRSEVTLANRVEVTRGNRTTVIGKNSQTLVGGSERERTEGNHQRFVGGDEDQYVVGSRRRRVQGDDHVVVGGNRVETVAGGYALSVAGDSHQKMSGSSALSCGGDIHLHADGAVVIEAGKDLTVRGPAGFIRITEDAIFIKGTLVNINSGTTQPGEGRGSKPSDPQPAVACEIEAPRPPDPDDVSVTGLGQ